MNTPVAISVKYMPHLLIRSFNRKIRPKGNKLIRLLKPINIFLRVSLTGSHFGILLFSKMCSRTVLTSKVQIEDDDILSWWSGTLSNALPSLRKLARRVLAIPATCTLAHDIGRRAASASASLPPDHQNRLNDILHVTYNLE